MLELALTGWVAAMPPLPSVVELRRPLVVAAGAWGPVAFTALISPAALTRTAYAVQPKPIETAWPQPSMEGQDVSIIRCESDEGGTAYSCMPAQTRIILYLDPTTTFAAPLEAGQVGETTANVPPP